MRTLLLLLVCCPLFGEPMPTDAIPLARPVLIEHLESLVPQVAVSGGGVAGVAVGISTPAQTTSACATLMAAFLVAAGGDDPYERDADLSATQNSDGCNTVAGEPKPQ